MAVPYHVVNEVATGAVQEITIPSPTCSITIRGRTTALEIYNSLVGLEYFTVAVGSSFGIDSHNLTGDVIYVKTTKAAIIEIIYQTRR